MPRNGKRQGPSSFFLFFPDLLYFSLVPTNRKPGTGNSFCKKGLVMCWWLLVFTFIFHFIYFAMSLVLYTFIFTNSLGFAAIVLRLLP